MDKQVLLRALLEQLENSGITDKPDVISEVVRILSLDTEYKEITRKILEEWNNIDWDWYPNG